MAKDHYPEIRRSMSLAWRFIPGEEGDFCNWGRGLVQSVDDLYKPRIFGPTHDLRCECGALVGEQYVGEYCFDCRIFVEADAAAARRRYMGVMYLPILCRHPFIGRDILMLPVAPVGFRIGKDGKANSLGRKYESLAALTAEVSPHPNSPPSLRRSGIREDANRLLQSLLGFFEPSPGLHDQPPNTLLGLFYHSLQTLDPTIPIWARCCGLAGGGPLPFSKVAQPNTPRGGPCARLPHQDSPLLR